MNKSLLALATIVALSSTSAFAEKFGKNMEAGVYGKVSGSQSDIVDDIYFEGSHLNAYAGYHINQKHIFRLDLGTRAYLKENSLTEFEYDFFVDEAYYMFNENAESNLKVGRFFNPVGLYGTSTYNYKEHPFTVAPNLVGSIDGINLNYLGKLQKNVFFDFNAFLGTTLEDIRYNNSEIDLDTGLNYGANVEIASPVGSFNFGLYGSNNGENIKVDGDNQFDDGGYLYQTNVSYEFSRKNLFFLADYNRTELSVDDEVDMVENRFDSQLGYKIGKIMPMIGYEYYANENLFINGEKNTNTVKAGIRGNINENLSVLFEYDYIMDQDGDEHDDQYVSLGLTYNY